jgi:hypothetical protein
MALKNDTTMINGPFEYRDLAAYFPDVSDPGTPPPGAGTAPAPDTNRTQADSAPRARPLSERDEFGYRFALQAKPLNFLLGQMAADKAPFPARFAVARIRLASFFGLEAEPALVLGGIGAFGGMGFLAGPSVLQTMAGYNSNPVTFSLKYEYVYFSTWGREQALLLEITHQIKMQHFLLGLGGELGAGLNGVSATDPDSFSHRKKEIVGTSNGVFFGLVFDMGFCL